jgi:hypothetical protein
MYTKYIIAIFIYAYNQRHITGYTIDHITNHLFPDIQISRSYPL